MPVNYYHKVAYLIFVVACCTTWVGRDKWNFDERSLKPSLLYLHHSRWPFVTVAWGVARGQKTQEKPTPEQLCGNTSGSTFVFRKKSKSHRHHDYFFLWQLFTETNSRQKNSRIIKSPIHNRVGTLGNFMSTFGFFLFLVAAVNPSLE